MLAELGVDARGARAAARGGRRVTVPPLTWLYVPADRPDRVEKALASRAHAVIVDLEDGVAPRREGRARATNLPALLGERARQAGATFASTPAVAADLEAVAQLAIDGVFVPKVERAERRRRRGCSSVHCADRDRRSALEAAFAIASHPGVHGHLARRGRPPLADGRARGGPRLGARAGSSTRPSPRGCRARRSRSTRTCATSTGSRASCRRGRELGHLGRAAIHPDQLPVIEQAYLPTAAEVETARETIERLERGAVGTLADGAFVDPAMLGGARQVVALAERYGTA